MFEALEGSTFIILWLVLIAGMYIWMSRRRKTQETGRREFLESLRKGDRVTTVGGIYGTLDAVDQETVILEVAQGVKIRLHKMGINARQEDREGQF